MPQDSLEQIEARPRVSATAHKDRNEPNMSVPRRSEAAGLTSRESSRERRLVGTDVQKGHPPGMFKSSPHAAPLRYRQTASGRDSMDTENAVFDGPSNATTTASTPPDEPSPFTRQEGPEPQVRRKAPSPPNSYNTSLDKGDQVATLSAQVQELREAQKRHIENANELEARILKNEVACGRMIESALEIGRMIELKKRHLAEDRERLSRERQSRDEALERVDSIMAQIGRIALGATGEDAH